ncbi:MAG TPA: DUF3570 domain-containing protein [Burkholderiales bacterium]|nr:DUF3570 domain-containing protein [Burkholderiales bacterium]
MYHYYDGGGVEVNGPALLVRKSFAEKISVNASRYVDSVSSASVDVVTTASPFKETRTEHRGGVEYLDGNSIIGISITRSHEPDYSADSTGISVAHELFGGMTTVSLGYIQGEDDVLKAGTSFQDKVERQQYRLGVSQILMRNVVASLNYEATSEEGFLNSPYRSARVLTAFVPERYPRTRNGRAIALRAIMAINATDGKPTSALGVGTRFFSDSWQVEANDFDVSYRRYFPRNWLGEVFFRHYGQKAASFYRDNFPTDFEFMARDKELSTFTNNTVGVKATWNFCGGSQSDWRCGLSFSVSRMRFEYDDFTDLRTGRLLSFDANVANVFVSLWY